MTQNSANLLMGAAQVYLGAFGAAEPLDSAVNAAPAASAWTEVGLTDGGVMMTITPKFTDFAADQIVDIPGTRLTSRTITVTTTMSEITLANLANALNSTVGATGANYATFEPNYGQFASQLPYAAIILDGWAVSPANVNFRRRIILRKTMQTSKVELNYTKDKQVGLSCTWQAYYVSNVIAPYHIADQTA
ncbi:hypothetical protein ATK30_6856 [Amycolatopsis echigonensis]|uniref:Uncharacterized protein n=1 Tax=Amycolatopsis echigonensis TaxID=2576905 RepID=A0A2N3WQ16_9PSEU|nr:hypothetical protein [Amycolatopsis niigatensis]PKV95923.1 hypothetical protein ATK30_6856 [Amycolatopsis niigatensis]